MKQFLNSVGIRITPVGCVAVAYLFLTSCATTPRILTDELPPGSLRLAQVMLLGTRKEITESKELHGILTAAGVKETEITDGSVVVARIYCCGGPAEKATAPMVYVPPGMNVEQGDVIEVRVGHPAKKGVPGELNTATQIRQKGNDKAGSCRWDPPNERLWMRVLYADWMPKEGWIYKRGISTAWYKPPPTKVP